MEKTMEAMITEQVKKAEASSPKVDEDSVCKEVLRLLGKPPKFYRITAGKVSDNAYRVNVWAEKPQSTGGVYECYEDNLCPSYLICDSFYVKVSPEGVISSTDPIKKKY
jgi:hypothetical protein